MRIQRLPFWLSLASFVAVFVLANAAIPLFTRIPAQQAAATYTKGNLAVTIPYHAESKGSGRLVAELLDPEDKVLGRVERTVDIVKGDGAWPVVIVPGKAIPFDEIIWQRLRYRFEQSGGGIAPIEGTESISQILRRPVVRIIGQTEYLAGGAAALRVIVADANHNDVAETGTVRIELLAQDQKPRVLYTGSLNRSGTLEAQFQLPAGLVGHFQMHTVADTPIGSAEFAQPIELKEKASILLTTEKPIYQPGQTIHVRALALDRAGMKADGSRKLLFEVEDSRGNKVFKKATETDRFGVASAEFPLADEVNLGTYHLRAVMGDPEAPANTAEVALNVERYVLPKFKVAVEFAAKDNKPQRFYKPGDHVTGTVRANYFFGKPVDRAGITVKASAMDVAVFQAASTTGKTDDQGVYHFDLKLPSYFAGRPLSQGAARALVEATVTDSANHAETRGEPITISESPMLVQAVPEGGTLVPRIENQVFLLTSYPDGTPAGACAVSVHLPNGMDVQVTTDSSGVAVIRFNPGGGVASLPVVADDHRGNRVVTAVPLQTRGGDDQILLRTSRGVVKAGDKLPLKVLSTRAGGTAYIDVVKNGQTILTRDLDLHGGEADLNLPMTPEMAGTLDIDAYLFGRNAQPVADHRLVFVQPADELKIETTTDAAVYKPGGDARIDFHVTNARGQGVSAALGLQIVDEAVFALAEKQPGFAKVFFYLEQEVMKPRYEIHSLSMPGVIDPISSGDGEQNRDLAARALFSATEMASPAKLDTEFGRSLPQEKYALYRNRYNTVFFDRVRELAGEVNKQIDGKPSGGKLPKLFDDLTLADSTRGRDAWGTRLRIEQSFQRGNAQYYLVRAAGPDHRFNTGDDLSTYVEEQTRTVTDRPGAIGGDIDVDIEHGRGPVTGDAAVAGKVFDMSGAIVPGATITLRRIDASGTRTAHSGRTGEFTLSGLPPGRYQAQLSSTGFDVASRDLTLEPRDRAVLTARLTVGSATQTIEVTVAQDQFVGVRSLNGVAMAGRAGGMGRGMAMPAPMAVNLNGGANAAATVLTGKDLDALSDDPDALRSQMYTLKSASPKPANAPHVRSYFPEALYINPEIITDGKGNANISIPVADSITTWRMAMVASTQAGAIGTGTSSMKVFQDFFVDLDLPVTLTQGDRVSIPVAVYNYAGKRGDVHLKLEPDADDWYTLDNDTADKTLEVDAGRVGGSDFTLRANRIGKFKLTLAAEMDGGGPARRDIVVREIEVVPNGREQDLVFNGRLESSVEQELHFPAAAIPDSTSVLVRLYPGPLSQVIEGMDGILRMPGGCFEQTSSSTYPNVLALDYMKRTKKLTPEVHAKAESYIANGYQRLLTFEVPGGGFSWFGQAPANKILTAYGLMEFNDMAKVSEVDPRLIQRTADWLARQQQPDGSWKPDTSFINEGATNRYNNNVLRITAYLAWSLANIGYQGPAIEKAKSFIDAQKSPQADVYTLAVIANFAADYGKDREFTRRAMQALIDARTETGNDISWNAEETGVYSTGSSAAVETTGLAVQALLKWGEASETVRKALSFISSKKQAGGNWGTTQATIMALRALLLASERGTADVRGNLEVVLNGKTVETLRLTPENNDLLHQFVFKGIDAQSSNSVQLKFEGTGGLAYQIVGRTFTPWEQKPAAEALSIDVAYDRTTMAQDDIATAKVTVRNNLNKTANMIMVDLGIPPGFDLLSEDLQTLQERSKNNQPGSLEKFNLTATQAILYFNALSQNQTVTFNYRLRAKYPIRAKTFASKVYEYYDPDVNSIARPVQLEVGKK